MVVERVDYTYNIPDKHRTYHRITSTIHIISGCILLVVEPVIFLFSFFQDIPYFLVGFWSGSIYIAAGCGACCVGCSFSDLRRKATVAVVFSVLSAVCSFSAVILTIVLIIINYNKTVKKETSYLYRDKPTQTIYEKNPALLHCYIVELLLYVLQVIISLMQLIYTCKDGCFGQENNQQEMSAAGRSDLVVLTQPINAKDNEPQPSGLPSQHGGFPPPQTGFPSQQEGFPPQPIGIPPGQILPLQNSESLAFAPPSYDDVMHNA